MPKIFIKPSNTEIVVESGTNLRNVLIKEGYPIKSTCGGCASCATCVVVIKDGDNNISEISFEEKQLLGNVFHITKERLSCQVEVLGDLTVDISLHTNEIPKKIIRKSKTQVEQEKVQHAQEASERPVKEGGFRRPKQFNYSKDED